MYDFECADICFLSFVSMLVSFGFLGGLLVSGCLSGRLVDDDIQA